MKRPSFTTAFWTLLGLFNLIATWLGPQDTAVIYGAVAICCFGMLATRMGRDRTMR